MIDLRPSTRFFKLLHQASAPSYLNVFCTHFAHMKGKHHNCCSARTRIFSKQQEEQRQLALDLSFDLPPSLILGSWYRWRIPTPYLFSCIHSSSLFLFQAI